MTIAVDFDGTIVEHEYPYIGKEIPFAIAALKKLQAERHLLILWSVREGELLDEAVEYCRKRGLEFYAVNSNHPGEDSGEPTPYCRKLNADLFIDDRNLGGLPDWGLRTIPRPSARRRRPSPENHVLATPRRPAVRPAASNTGIVNHIATACLFNRFNLLCPRIAKTPAASPRTR